MKAIVIKPKNRKEENFIRELLQKMNIENHLIEEPIPNYTTIEAIKDVEMKKGNRVKDSDELFSELKM